MSITINNKELNVKLKDEKTVLDISKYLNKGENKITYLIEDENTDYSKSVNVYIEIKEAIDD